MSARDAIASGGARTNPITLRRVVVGIIVAAIGLGAVVIPWAFYLLILASGWPRSTNSTRSARKRASRSNIPSHLLGVCGYVLMAAFGMLHKWEGVLLAAIVIAAFWIGMYGEQKGYFARTAYTLLAALYIGKLLTYFVFVRQIPGDGIWMTYLRHYTSH